jgi:hypothetical protein
MTKLLMFASVLLFLAGCEKPTEECPEGQTSTTSSEGPKTCSAPEPQTPTDPGPVPNPDPNPVPEPVPAPAPVPNPSPNPAPPPAPEVSEAALRFDANFTLFEFDNDDEKKVSKAIEIIKRVVATKDFKDRVLGFTYNGKRTFVDNGNLSNEQIYQKILDGSETLRPGKDNQMDLELELYYSWRSTVGYTYPDDLRIYMNTKFFDYYTPTEVAGNVFHEWTHKLGFDHASSYSVSRDSSVPYALGYLMEELGKKYEK